MNRFLIRMYFRNLTANELWLPKAPIGGSKNAATFGTGLWLSMVIITSLTMLLAALQDWLPNYLHAEEGHEWFYWALWIPVLFTCDRYVARLVAHYDPEATADQPLPSKRRGETLYWVLQWASLLPMLIVIAEVRSAG